MIPKIWTQPLYAEEISDLPYPFRFVSSIYIDLPALRTLYNDERSSCHDVVIPVHRQFHGVCYLGYKTIPLLFYLHRGDDVVTQTRVSQLLSTGSGRYVISERGTIAVVWVISFG